MTRKQAEWAKREAALHGKIVRVEPMPQRMAPRKLNGPDFERAVEVFFLTQGLHLSPKVLVPVGVGDIKKEHAFDLGSEKPPVLVECKSHTWTQDGNVPSAKLSVWNEAMYYFACVRGFRKIFAVQRDLRRGESLAEYYIRHFPHLIPGDVEIWELDPTTQEARRLAPDVESRRRPTKG